MDQHYHPSWQQKQLDADTLFGALIRTAVDGIMVIDEQGVVQVYNQACEQLFQYTEHEVIGRNVKMLMPTPHREHHDSYLKAYRHTGQARILGIGREVAGQRKDGSTFPMYLSVGEGLVGAKRVFVGIVHDLSALYSERESYEARLHNLRDELMHVARVSELGQVSAGIAHELNQPLSAMLNYANAAKRLAAAGGPDTLEKVQSILTRIGEQAQRAGQIVQRMRGFLEKGTHQHGEEDIVAIAEDAMALGLLGTGSTEVDVVFLPDHSLPRVKADRVQIQQVLVNLLRNAVEAMDGTSHRQLTLVLENLETCVEVRVSDTGPGIDPAIADRLFKPFVTTKQNGMGIGLAISKSIIETHGSVLTAEPNPGGGALFRFTLPCATVTEDDEAGNDGERRIA